MDLFCENCGAKIHAEEVNIKADIAKCTACNTVSKASELIRLRERRQLAIVPPVGSRIDSFRYSDNILEIKIPRHGIRTASQIGSLGFGCFWIGFVAVWTTFAWMGAGFMALFSIPFWTVGFAMIYGFTKAAFESQSIELNGHTMKITKNRLLNSKEVVLDLMDIDQIDMKGLSSNKQFTGLVLTDQDGKPIDKQAGVTVPTINFGVKKETVLNYGNHAEKKWLTQLLKNYVFDVTQREV